MCFSSLGCCCSNSEEGLGEKKRSKTGVETGDESVDGMRRDFYDVEEEEEKEGKVIKKENVGKEDANCNSIQNAKSVIVETHF